MKKLSTLLIVAALFSHSQAQYSGGGGVTSAQLATKLGTNAVVQTTGTNTDQVISQAANTTILDGLQEQINNAGLFAVELYLSTNKVNAGYAPTNSSYLMCEQQTTNVSSFTVTYSGVNSYGYIALCTNTVYYTNTAGTATFIDWSSENASGSMTEKFELYALVVGTTNEVEVGDTAIPQLVSSGSTPTMRTFSIPYSAYGNTNGYYFGIRSKLTANSSGLLTKTQWAGNGYNTHITYSQPSAILTDQFVSKEQITQTVTDGTDDIPSCAAVSNALVGAGLGMNFTNGTAELTISNLTVTGSAVLPSITVDTLNVSNLTGSGVTSIKEKRLIAMPVAGSIFSPSSAAIAYSGSSTFFGLKHPAISSNTYYSIDSGATNVVVSGAFGSVDSTNYQFRINCLVKSVNPDNTVNTTAVPQNQTAWNASVTNFTINVPLAIHNTNQFMQMTIFCSTNAAANTFTTNGVFIMESKEQF